MPGIKTPLAACTLLIVLAACGDEISEQVDARAGDRLPWLNCRLEADGTFALDFGFAEDRKLLTRGTLGAKDPAAQRATRNQLCEAMALALQGGRYRQPDALAVITLRLEGAPDAPWPHAKRIIDAAYSPAVKIVRFELRRMGEPTGTRLDLPSGGRPYMWGGIAYFDEGFDDEWVDDIRLAIKLLRRTQPGSKRTFTRMEVGDEHLDLDVGGRPSAPVFEVAMNKVKRALAGALTLEFVMPPPHGPQMPYGDVLHLVTALRQRGQRYFSFADAGRGVLRFRVR